MSLFVAQLMFKDEKSKFPVTYVSCRFFDMQNMNVYDIVAVLI